MNKELKKIKKLYGEAMMHFCRDNFALILETPDLLLNILTSNFHPTHELYKDLEENNLFIDFKNFIFKKFKKDKDTKKIVIIKSPEDLMAKAGYDLYECLTEDDIQKFRKYYVNGEELCTFRTHRLETNRVFFAVKKNVRKIKRENFPHPLRQDEYGTSVISIQFTKDGTNTLSIKNRYNHTVENPDATFSNDLDNIVPGLTKSFEKYYGLKQLYENNDFEIPSYVKANDGKYYKYNYEIDNIYYCPDNIIIDNFEVKKYPKEKYLILDYFILDLVNQVISHYEGFEVYRLSDSFLESIGKIKKVEIKNEGEGKKVLITPLDGEIIEIGLDKLNRIIRYKNNNIKEVKRYFLYFNGYLNSIEMNNAEIIQNNFLRCNETLKDINLPKVKYIGDCFLEYNECLKNLSMPKLEILGCYFLYENLALEKINLPKIRIINDSFMGHNKKLKELFLPNLEEVGNSFLIENAELTTLDLPKLKTVGNYFLTYNKGLETAYLPNLEIGGVHFLSIYTDYALRVFIAPKLKELKDYYAVSCFYENHPNLEEFITADGNFSLQRKLD